ncbi:MAG: hypothetical protein NTY47_05430, partial [Candidatus Omnitrophica bacterium]|nr:hypothetical protein [Candidatus Omnitrophota bacterium]
MGRLAQFDATGEVERKIIGHTDCSRYQEAWEEANERYLPKEDDPEYSYEIEAICTGTETYPRWTIYEYDLVLIKRRKKGIEIPLAVTSEMQRRSGETKTDLMSFIRKLGNLDHGCADCKFLSSVLGVSCKTQGGFVCGAMVATIGSVALLGLMSVGAARADAGKEIANAAVNQPWMMQQGWLGMEHWQLLALVVIGLVGLALIPRQQKVFDTYYENRQESDGSRISLNFAGYFTSRGKITYSKVSADGSSKEEQVLHLGQKVKVAEELAAIRLLAESKMPIAVDILADYMASMCQTRTMAYLPYPHTRNFSAEDMGILGDNIGSGEISGIKRKLRGEIFLGLAIPILSAMAILIRAHPQKSGQILRIAEDLSFSKAGNKSPVLNACQWTLWGLPEQASRNTIAGVIMARLKERIGERNGFDVYMLKTLYHLPDASQVSGLFGLLESGKNTQVMSENYQGEKQPRAWNSLVYSVISKWASSLGAGIISPEQADMVLSQLQDNLSLLPCTVETVLLGSMISEQIYLLGVIGQPQSLDCLMASIACNLPVVDARRKQVAGYLIGLLDVRYPYMAQAAVRGLGAMQEVSAADALVRLYQDLGQDDDAIRGNGDPGYLGRFGTQNYVMSPLRSELLDACMRIGNICLIPILAETAHWVAGRSGFNTGDNFNTLGPMQYYLGDLAKIAPEQVIEEIADNMQDVDQNNKAAVVEQLNRFIHTPDGKHEFETTYYLYRLRQFAGRLSGKLLKQRFDAVSDLVRQAHLLIGPIFITLFGYDDQDSPVLSDNQFKAFLNRASRHMGAKNRAGLNAAADKVRVFARNWHLMTAVLAQLLLWGNLKRHVWELNKDIRQEVANRGCAYEPFTNLNDVETVKEAIENILSLVQENERAVLGASLAVETGYKLSDFARDPELYNIYADEVAQVFGANRYKFSQDNIGLINGQLERLSYVRGQGIEFMFLKRDISELNLGAKARDCTALGSQNFWTVATYLTHPGCQILQVFYDGRLVDKLHLVLFIREDQDSAAVSIDGHEPIPQLEQGDSEIPALSAERENIFDAGIAKTVEIADRMNVRTVWATDISNRRYTRKLYRQKYSRSDGLVPVNLLGNLEPEKRWLARHSYLDQEKPEVYLQTLLQGDLADEECEAIREMEYDISRIENSARKEEFDRFIQHYDFESAAGLLRIDPYLKGEVISYEKIFSKYGHTLA